MATLAPITASLVHLRKPIHTVQTSSLFAGDIFPNFAVGDNAISILMVSVICLQTFQEAATDLITLGHVTASGRGTMTNQILASMMISIVTQGPHDVHLRLHFHADPKFLAAHPDAGLPLVRETCSRGSRGPDCEYDIDLGSSTATQEQNHDIFGPFTTTSVDKH